MVGDPNIRDVADAVKGALDATPIYQDAIQPAAKQLGASLCTVAEAIDVALAPLRALVWGYDQVSEFLRVKLEAKLDSTPSECITTPSLQVVVPAIDALRYAGGTPLLGEMFATLIATSLDARSTRYAHPAYVDIIRHLTPDEARLLLAISFAMKIPCFELRATTPNQDGWRMLCPCFTDAAEKAGCENAELYGAYVNNLCRLGLAEHMDGTYLLDEEAYDQLKQHAYCKSLEAKAEAMGRHLVYSKGIVRMTPLGSQFVKACMRDMKSEEIAAPKADVSPAKTARD